MVRYLITILLIFYLSPPTLAIKCLECYQALGLDSSDWLNTSTLQCYEKYKPSQMCTSVLSIEFENNNATVIFDHLPEQVMVLSHEHKMSRNSMTIWFDKNITTLSFQSICANSKICVEDMNKTYNTMKQLKHAELRKKLQERLHSPQSNVVNLTCSNDRGQTIFCPNGSCRLIRRDLSHLGRSCVSQNDNTNPLGVFIESDTTAGSTLETMFTYACNKPMCNSIEASAYVQHLLEQYELWPLASIFVPVTTQTTLITTSFPTTTTRRASEIPSVGSTFTTYKPVNTTETTNITNSTVEDTPSPSAAMRTIHQTIIDFQWLFLLIMTILFRV